MKRVFPILGFLLFNYYLFAQDITVDDRYNPVSKVVIPTSSWLSCENGMYYYEEYGDLTKSVLTKNIGIGLFNPLYKLHAAGDICADGGWLKATGSKGLYFESFGGGMYMTDATWIRTYGNKSFYHNTGTMRTDGTFQVGPSGDRFIVNTSGNVGIATITPTEKLQVEGNIRLLNDCGYIKKVKGLYFGWASSYGTQFNHGIFSTDGTAYSDDITLNSYGNVRVNFDSNNNGTNKFSIGNHTTGLVNTLFTVDGSGNVGIGVSTPTKTLDVSGDINYTGNLYKNGQIVDFSGTSTSPWINTGSKIYYPVGDVGIGITPIDGAKLQIKQGWGTWIRFLSITNTGYWAFCNGEEQETFHIYYKNPDGSIIYPLRLKKDGSIETKELLVTEVKADDIFSKELTLEIENVADYVFDKEYKLNSIKEVEDFVKTNKHLPGIPSANELEEQGVNVAEMSNLLLQKVEELTLYIIQLENRISEIENK